MLAGFASSGMKPGAVGYSIGSMATVSAGFAYFSVSVSVYDLYQETPKKSSKPTDPAGGE